MTSKEALEKVIEDISLEWGYEGIEDELREKLKPLYEDLDRLEKLEKVLEIIKTKCATNTNLWLLVCTRTYEDYESFVENKDHKLVRLEHNILTQQEYDLLKEMLEK